MGHRRGRAKLNVQLVEMQTRLSQRLNEGVSGPVFYPTSELTAALNEAQRFFCLLTLCLEQTSDWSVTYSANNPSHNMLTIFSDWITPLRIQTAGGAKVRPAEIEDLNALDSQWWTSTATPSRYAMRGMDFLLLYGHFAGAGNHLTATYARAPVALAGSTDVPEIRAPYHPALVSYGIYRLRQVEGGQEFAKVMSHLNDFLDAAHVEAEYVRARNVGSGYDRTPFELANFDRSLLLGRKKGPRPEAA